MAKVFYPPACDAELLSAYRDSALDTERRQRLETHLAGCPACRQELLRFEFLSATLLQLPAQTRPRPLSRTFRRQAPQRPLPHRSLPAAGAVAGAAMAALLFIVFFQRMPSRPSALFAAYPPAGASNVSTDTSIVLTFQGPVDQTQVQRALRFEPPVPFDVAWDSDRRAEVLPLQPFAAATTYTLLAALPPVPTVSPPPSPLPGTLPAAAPQTLTIFHTAPVSVDAGGPLPALSRRQLLRQQQVASATQEVLSVPATPTPVTLPNAAGPTSRMLASNGSGGAPELTSASGKAAGASENRPTIGAALAESLERPALLPPCAPANLFTPLYSSRGDVRSALGCVVGPARAGTLVSQEFQRGILLALLPDNMLYELTADGLWSAAPLGPPAANGAVTGEERTVGPAFLPYWQAHTALRSRLGIPIGPQARSEALVQRFAHGRMLSSGDWLYVADDAGQWQRLVSPAPDGSGTPVAGGGAITGGVPSFPPMRRATAPTVTPAARQLAVAAASPRAAKAVLR